MLILGLMAGTVFADPAFFPRRPTISPDGSQVIFSFQGDLWSVPADGGRATRLTVHPAYDRNAVYSPDGTQIVFASDRYDTYDLFVMSSTGGTPERLTYLSVPDVPQAWTADGKILFSSRRIHEFPQDTQIFEISADGGTPFRFADFFAEEVAVSPDGGSYLFAIGDNRFGRRGYRGTMQSEIWLWTPGTVPVQLTDHPGYDSDPMWSADGQTVYFRSDMGEDGIFNICRMNRDGSGKEVVTNFLDLGVRNAMISANGQRIVMEAETDLYILETASGRLRRLAIDIAADMLENPVSVDTRSGGASDLSAGPEGEELALVIDGELVLFNTELEGRAVVPVPDPARDYDIYFKPGSTDTLLFVSDRDGEESIYLLMADDEEVSPLRTARHFTVENLTPGDEACHSPKWSPDGSRIAYLRGAADLHIMDHDGGSDRVLLEGWAAPSFNWSPDGNWIAYSREDRNYNSDVWIIDAEGDMDPVNISQHPDDDMGPVWSGDGSILAWTTRRHDNQYDVYYVYLKQSDHERTRDDWKLWELTRDEEPESDGEDDEDEAEEEEFVIEIDFDNIHLRGRRLTDWNGNEFAIAVHPKGDRIYFLGNVEGDTDLYSLDRFGEDLSEVTSGGTDPSVISYDKDKEKFWFLKSGTPASVSADGGSVETYSFRATIRTDKRDLRLQVMDEAWRGLNMGFYDPNFHGVDWPGIRTQFQEYVQKVSHDNDFADLMMMMLRSLNASHSGYYPANRRAWYGVDEMLGVEFDPEYAGEGLKIADIIPHGPADKVENRLQVGDVITAINDVPVSRTENFYRAMELGAQEPVYVAFNRGRDEMEYLLRPASWRQLNGLRYDDMTLSNREYVEEQTDGDVGYVHIEGMGWAEVELFERDLYAAADDKDALIIDVRDNGGGWTTDMLLTILTQPVHAYTIGRDGEVGYPQPRYPLYRWEKPIAVICNEGSYSNAEIFSHAIKTINRGPVIGIQTGGNVISTSGWTMMDGAHVRLPMRGWYVWGDSINTERNNLNEEHNGAVPDYIVPLTPGDRMEDRDPQLDQAIELMMQAVEEWRARPQPGEEWE